MTLNLEIEANYAIGITRKRKQQISGENTIPNVISRNELVQNEEIFYRTQTGGDQPKKIAKLLL